MDLKAKFSKRASADLVKKVKGGNCTPEERAVVFEILKRRKVDLKANGIDVKKKAKATSAKKKVKAKKDKSSSKPSKNEDIVVDFLSVGQTVPFISKSKEKLQGTVVKIYNCSRTGKEYVRLKSNGKVFHKRLNHFQPST